MKIKALLAILFSVMLVCGLAIVSNAQTNPDPETAQAFQNRRSKNYLTHFIALKVNAPGKPAAQAWAWQTSNLRRSLSRKSFHPKSQTERFCRHNPVEKLKA